MSKNDKQHALVPRLRFPEFSKPWPLAEIAPYLIESGSRAPASTKLPVYTCSRAGLQPQSEYYGGNNVANRGEYGIVPQDHFVYRHMSDDGVFAFHINKTGDDIAVSKEYPVFKGKGINSDFLLALLNFSPSLKQFALAQKAGGTRTRLYLSKLKKWPTPIPSLAEQQKIAGCLGSLDDLPLRQHGRAGTGDRPRGRTSGPGINRE